MEKISIDIFFDQSDFDKDDILTLQIAYKNKTGRELSFEEIVAMFAQIGIIWHIRGQIKMYAEIERKRINKGDKI